jgi:CRP-like cAMP-binding protein
VKIILHYSSIVYLNKGQTLYADGFNDQFIYIILFGRIKILDGQTHAKKGQTLNIGWTVGEEILFKPENEHGRIQRTDICRASTEACVLGIVKKNLTKIKQTLQEKGQHDEFMKLEIVLRAWKPSRQKGLALKYNK